MTVEKSGGEVGSEGVGVNPRVLEAMTQARS